MDYGLCNEQGSKQKEQEEKDRLVEWKDHELRVTGLSPSSDHGIHGSVALVPQLPVRTISMFKAKGLEFNDHTVIRGHYHI